MKGQKGITILSLSITLILMGIIAGTVIAQSMNYSSTKGIKNLYNDLELLQNKINLYYIKYGDIPKKDLYDYNNTDFINNNSDKNAEDNNVYYVIDLEALDNISLSNYPSGEDDDVYVVNEKTHTVYYPLGIELNGEKHYSLP